MDLEGKEGREEPGGVVRGKLKTGYNVWGDRIYFQYKREKETKH